MSKSRTLLTYHDLNVEVEATPSEELLEHMHATIMGQPGSFRFRQTNLEDKLKTAGENYYMFLRMSGKMMGSVGFCGKAAETHGVKHNSWLIRYFSFKVAMAMICYNGTDFRNITFEDIRVGPAGQLITVFCSEVIFGIPGNQQWAGRMKNIHFKDIKTW